jgi:hypothetical protein
MSTKGQRKRKEGRPKERTPGKLGTSKRGWTSQGKAHNEAKRLSKVL